MATQIAPTPMLKGKEAHQVYKEMYTRPSREAESGAKKLSELFSKLTKK